VAKENTTRYAVLGMLSLGPMSGYDVRRLIGESIGHAWSESYGQVYPALRSLAGEGLATVETEEQEGRPNRKVYTITEAGLEELRRWVAGPIEPRPRRNELLLKLFFGRHVPASHFVGVVEQVREQQARALEEFAAAEEDAPPEDRESPDFPYWTMTLRFGRLIGEATLRWCDETLAALRELDRGERAAEVKEALRPANETR
jgi:PadR family transcriptional regulator AphA